MPERRYHIVTLPGDGVGPEVVAAALAVLDETGALHGFTVSRDQHLIGGASIDASSSFKKPSHLMPTTLCQKSGQ